MSEVVIGAPYSVTEELLDYFKVIFILYDYDSTVSMTITQLFNWKLFFSVLCGKILVDPHNAHCMEYYMV